MSQITVTEVSVLYVIFYTNFLLSMCCNTKLSLFHKIDYEHVAHKDNISCHKIQCL